MAFPVANVVMAVVGVIAASKAKKKAEERQEAALEIKRLYVEKAEDIELSQQLAVSRENLMSYMRTSTDRSLNEVLQDYEYAEPQPTVYQLAPAKEPTFAERVNAFIEAIIEQVVTTLRL